MGRRVHLASALALGAVVAASLLAPTASATPSAAPAYTWASLIGGSSNDTVTAATVGTVTPSASGRHWLVRVLDPLTATYELIEAKSGFEGSGQSEAGAPTVQVAATNALITFRGLGGTQGLAAAATFDFTNPSAGACHTTVTPGPIRCLRLQVSVAGQIRMCDPSVDPATHPGDTRLC